VKRLMTSTDHSRHFEQPGFERRIRRVVEQLRPRQRGRRHIVAIDRAIHDLRRRRDAGGIQRANLFDVSEDVAELPGEEIELVLRQLEPGQFRDALNILPGK
jgi:hypothetical protein